MADHKFDLFVNTFEKPRFNQNLTFVHKSWAIVLCFIGIIVKIWMLIRLMDEEYSWAESWLHSLFFEGSALLIAFRIGAALFSILIGNKSLLFLLLLLK